MVSPLYETDHSVYVTTDEGLWLTIDEGETFALVDSLAENRPDALTPYIETGPVSSQPAQRHAALLLAGRVSRKLDPPLNVPILGSPDDDLHFAVAPTSEEDGESFVFASRIDQTDGFRYNLRLYACNAAFSCPMMLFEFPDYETFGNVWFGPDYERSGSIFVETFASGVNGSNANSRPTLWHSVDRGRSFRRVALTEHIFDRVDEIGGKWGRVHVAADPVRPGSIFLRVSFEAGFVERPRPADPPAEQIFESQDGGQTWTRVSFGRHLGQVGRQGSIPWNNHNGPVEPAYLWLRADGRLLVLAKSFGAGPLYKGPYCSVDRGRTWEKLCASPRP